MLQVYDRSSGSVTATGLAVHSSFSEAAFHVSGADVAFAVDEGQQGAMDLNGDGDAVDFLVLHVGRFGALR